MIHRLSCLALLALLSLPAQSAMLYTDRMLFESMLDVKVTDGYDLTNYSEEFYTDVNMSAVLGETVYLATGVPFTNRVTGTGPGRHYCSGCNGSFLLDFTSTSTFGPSDGVYGVGLDVFGDEMVAGITAFVTFGDGSTMNYAIPDAAQGQFPFWGITDDALIASIHFGGRDGATSAVLRMALDNLTIGSMGDMPAVPIPAAIWLFASALVGLAGLRRRAVTREA